jgi:hypothetical protein
VRRVDIWESEYLHILEGDNPVFAWTKGTALRPYLDVLDESHLVVSLPLMPLAFRRPTGSNRMAAPCCPFAVSLLLLRYELEKRMG